MALVSVDEYNLVSAHREGDTHAFADIVRRYHPALTAHARRRLCDAHAAEDVVQETFLRAYRALPAFDGEYRLGAWLHRIVDNVCNDQLDRRRREDQIRTRLESWFDDTDVLDIDAVIARDESAHALEALSDDQRTALVQRFVEDKSYEEIATTFGVTQQAARARVSRARRALRRLFELPGASALAIGGFARRLSARSASATADAPATPRLGLAAQLVPTLPSTTQSTVNLATKVVLAATAAVAVAVPATQGTGSIKVPAPPAVRAEAPATEAATAEPAAPATAVASPDTTSTSAAADPTSAATDSSSSSASSSSSSSAAPPPVAVVVPPVSGEDTSSTPPPAAGVVREATLESTTVELTQAGPRYVLSGTATLVGADGTSTPLAIDGKVLLDESDPSNIAVDGTITLTTDDGRTMRLQLSGAATRTDDGTSSPRFTLDTRYVLDGADLVGLAHEGTLGGALTNNGDGTGSFTFDLQGTEG